MRKLSIERYIEGERDDMAGHDTTQKCSRVEKGEERVWFGGWRDRCAARFSNPNCAGREEREINVIELSGVVRAHKLTTIYVIRVEYATGLEARRYCAAFGKIDTSSITTQ